MMASSLAHTINQIITLQQQIFVTVQSMVLLFDPSPRHPVPPKRHHNPHWLKPYATMHDHSRSHRVHLTSAKHHVHRPRALFGAELWVA
jgi:hypothetical protein